MVFRFRPAQELHAKISLLFKGFKILFRSTLNVFIHIYAVTGLLFRTFLAFIVDSSFIPKVSI